MDAKVVDGILQRCCLFRRAGNEFQRLQNISKKSFITSILTLTIVKVRERGQAVAGRVTRRRVASAHVRVPHLPPLGDHALRRDRVQRQSTTLSMSTSTTRKPAPRIAKPAYRYRPGKAPKGYEDAVEEDSDEGEEVEGAEGEDEEGAEERLSEVEDEEDDGGMAIKTAPVAKQAKGMSLNLKQVDISKDGKVIIGGKEETGRTAMEGTYVALNSM